MARRFIACELTVSHCEYDVLTTTTTYFDQSSSYLHVIVKHALLYHFTDLQ